jgi:hypothetical protein
MLQVVSTSQSRVQKVQHGNPSNQHAVTLRYWETHQKYKVELVLKAIQPAVLLRVLPCNPEVSCTCPVLLVGSTYVCHN